MTSSCSQLCARSVKGQVSSCFEPKELGLLFRGPNCMISVKGLLAFFRILRVSSAGRRLVNKLHVLKLPMRRVKIRRRKKRFCRVGKRVSYLPYTPMSRKSLCSCACPSAFMHRVTTVQSFKSVVKDCTDQFNLILVRG